MCVLSNSAGLICYLNVRENLFSPLQLGVLWYDPFDSVFVLCEMKLSSIAHVLMWLSHCPVHFGLPCVCFRWRVYCSSISLNLICPLKYVLILYWATVWYLMLPPLVQSCAPNHEYQNYSYGSSGIMLTHPACTQCGLHIILGARIAYLVFWLGSSVDKAGIGFWKGQGDFLCSRHPDWLWEPSDLFIGCLGALYRGVK